MSIPETFHFDNRGEVVEKSPIKTYFWAIVIILVSLLSFGIGRLTAIPREGVKINFDQNLLSQGAEVRSSLTPVTQGKISASVNGTKYYYPHCKNNISEKNKIFFDSAMRAEEAGYELAMNCKAK